MGLYDDDDDDDNVVQQSSASSSAQSLKREHQDDADAPKSKKAAVEASTSAADAEPAPVSSSSTLPKSPQLPPLLHAASAKKGERDDMQDAHLCLQRILAHRTDLPRCALYAVFDGHGGARAAEYCAKEFCGVFEARLEQETGVEANLKRVFGETFKKLDDGFIAVARANKPPFKDGTTATTVLILEKVIYAANIGDSRAIVARLKTEDGDEFVPVQLTIDHNPMMHEERMRIQKAGASVIDGRVNGILEVSRSIGDGPFKTYGVTSKPDIKKLTITPRDKFVIVACDGLWKVFSNEEAAKFVWKGLEKRSKSVLEADSTAWDAVVDELVAEAIRRKCGDNVSAILIRLAPVS